VTCATLPSAETDETGAGLPPMVMVHPSTKPPPITFT